MCHGKATQRQIDRQTDAETYIRHGACITLTLAIDRTAGHAVLLLHWELYVVVVVLGQQ